MGGSGSSEGFIPALTAWVSENAFWLIAVSVAYFAVSLVVIRFLVIRMPPDYFLPGRSPSGNAAHPLLRVALRIGKNILGLVVIAVGLVMSVPGVAGQGVLTILLGLSLTDFPGKRRLELRLVRQPLILRAINGVREKAGKPPLIIPDGDDDGTAEGGPPGG